jgi:hypothetical protein
LFILRVTGARADVSYNLESQGVKTEEVRVVILETNDK